MNRKKVIDTGVRDLVIGEYNGEFMGSDPSSVGRARGPTGDTGASATTLCTVLCTVCCWAVCCWAAGTTVAALATSSSWLPVCAPAFCGWPAGGVLWHTSQGVARECPGSLESVQCFPKSSSASLPVPLECMLGIVARHVSHMSAAVS